MNRRDPRIRQTLDRLQSEFETANLNAQASIYTFSERYVNPCLQSLSQCLDQSCAPCFHRTPHRQRHMSRAGRPELSFDFYNDFWDDYDADSNAIEPDETTGLLDPAGHNSRSDWDRLLAGGGSTARGDGSGAQVDHQPKRQGGMNYGSGSGTGGAVGPASGPATDGKGVELDAQDYPGSSMFGFLESLPWKIGRRGLRYQPSAANLQENPHRKLAQRPPRDHYVGIAAHSSDEEDYDGGRHPTQGHRRGLSAIIAGRGGEHNGNGNGAGEGRSGEPSKNHSRHNSSLPKTRKRSGTETSRRTSNSLSSRGDLFPSDDEADAVPIDDAFTTALTRRRTGGETGTTTSGGRKSSARSVGTSKSKSSSRKKNRLTRHDSGAETEETDYSSAGPTSPAALNEAEVLELQLARGRQEEVEIARRVAEVRAEQEDQRAENERNEVDEIEPANLPQAEEAAEEMGEFEQPEDTPGKADRADDSL